MVNFDPTKVTHDVDDHVGVRGFLRVQLVNKKTRKIEGDSGYRRNTITTHGINDCVAGSVIAQANSVQISSALLATQSTAVDVSQVSLVGTCIPLITVFPSTEGGGTARVTCSFDGANLTANTLTIGSMGLHFTNTASQSLLAGQTFTTSQMNSDQDANCTYEIRFA